MAPKVQTASNTKSGKAAKTTATKAVVTAAVAAPEVDSDEDEDEEGGAQAGGAAAGMTPTLQKEESPTPMTPKNFRNHPDMENFFRFIYENDLRLEGLEIIDSIIAERKIKKKKVGNA